VRQNTKKSVRPPWVIKQGTINIHLIITMEGVGWTTPTHGSQKCDAQCNSCIIEAKCTVWGFPTRLHFIIFSACNAVTNSPYQTCWTSSSELFTTVFQTLIWFMYSLIGHNHVNATQNLTWTNEDVWFALWPINGVLISTSHYEMTCPRQPINGELISTSYYEMICPYIATNL